MLYIFLTERQVWYYIHIQAKLRSKESVRHTSIAKPEESDKNFRLFLESRNTFIFSAIASTRFFAGRNLLIGVFLYQINPFERV